MYQIILMYQITFWFSENTISVLAQGLTSTVLSICNIFQLLPTSSLIQLLNFTCFSALSVEITSCRRLFLSLPSVNELMKCSNAYHFIFTLVC